MSRDSRGTTVGPASLSGRRRAGAEEAERRAELGRGAEEKRNNSYAAADGRQATPTSPKQAVKWRGAAAAQLMRPLGRWLHSGCREVHIKGVAGAGRRAPAVGPQDAARLPGGTWAGAARPAAAWKKLLR